MGLYLEQSNPLTTGPKPWKNFAQVFEKSEAEYIYSNFKIQIVANLHWKDMQCLRSCTPLATTGNNNATCQTVCLVCVFSVWQPLSCTFVILGFVVVLCNTVGRKELGMHCKWSLSKAGCIWCCQIWGSCGTMLSRRVWDSRSNGRGALMLVSICMLSLPIW